MKQPHLLTILILFLGLWGNPSLLKADWNNFVINYNKNLYGKGTQTWQIASYNDHWVYFANKNGMVQFDGYSWDLFPLHNGSDIRSVCPSTQLLRIYAGGINEFGYFEPADDGRLIYTCLSDSVPPEEKYIGNIWGIHENDHILYFQGDGRILKYLNGKFTTIDSEMKIDCSDLVNNVLYLGTERGVRVLVGNTIFPLQGAEMLENMRIRGVIPYQEGVMIATAYDGLFYYNGRYVVPYPTGIEPFLKEHEVFSIACHDNLIALGTVHKGLVLIHTDTGQIKYFNENNGLQNNTVLSVHFDHWGNLWAGLDNGIDYILLNSVFTTLYSSFYSFGTGYTAFRQGNYLYLGTNRGLFYTEYPVKLNENFPDIRPVPQSSGQVWNLCEIDGELFCLHDRGVFRVEGDRVSKVVDLAGAWNCQPVMGQPGRMFVGVYGGLYLLEKRQGKWEVCWRIEGISDSCRFFEQESSRVLWICNTDYVMRVELSQELTHVENMRMYNSEYGFPTDRDIYVSKVEGNIFFPTPDGIYAYNEKADRMEQAREMNTMLHGTHPYSRLIQYRDHVISLSHREICIAPLRSYKRGAHTLIVPLDLSSIELVQGAEAILPLSDSLFILPNDNGFALCKIPALKKNRDYNNALSIRNVFLPGSRDSLIYRNNFLGIQPEVVLPYSRNAIRFEYGLSAFIQGEEVSYQQRLNNQEWSDYTTATIKEYGNLAEGNYLFEVKAIFPDGRVAQDQFRFRILPPWYRTNIAYILYLMLFGIILFFVYRWDDTRVQRKKQQAVVEKDKELHQLERVYEEETARKERQIMELEKEKLEHELQYKSQEMANLMINFVRKNEILTEIKSELLKVISSLKSKDAKEYRQMLLLINNKIDDNIQSDEVLKRIEEQFDLVHNNFMKRLGEKHPDLSLNERMMCAYLKMNLSSKEIAPLLNISVRGVETIRYRLRKKFVLDREESLIEYLNSKL